MTFLHMVHGDSPLILGFPHTGTDLPDHITPKLNSIGRGLADTDWHIDQLYENLVADVSSVKTTIHRYAVDVNRDPNGIDLYSGHNSTSLCPTTDFDGNRIYHDDEEPDEIEIEWRQQAYHAPYHAAITKQIQRVRAIHGFAILYDCHSIRSRLPFLFEGELPDFNIGTNFGHTCAPDLEAVVFQLCKSTEGYTTTLNGRFVGGWTTRHYGDPANGVHAIQMELAQSTYLRAEAPPWDYDERKVSQLRSYLSAILEKLKGWRPR
ncbi:MAG: N-formylglutamate deformylase [Aestuariivita sp.]|nr:N-formylglutamate deformylase [Aestuariivita sp.]MCY4203571.1 N-formylglutamate deformylase [Aestuariivita sp.]